MTRRETVCFCLFFFFCTRPLEKYELVTTVICETVNVEGMRVQIAVFVCARVCLWKLIMLMLSFFCHIAMATVPSRCNGGRVRQSYLFSPSPSLHPPITLSFPPSHFIFALSLLQPPSLRLSPLHLLPSFFPLLFLPLSDWLNTLLLKMRYCLMRQRAEEEREGDKEQVSLKKKKGRKKKSQ